MSVRANIRSFLIDPQGFAAATTEESQRLWLTALDEFAIPVGTAHGKLLGKVQQSAWRTLAANRLGLILGPPGTGKTFALSWMAISYLLARRSQNLPCRVLLTGFTVNSITNLLEGVAEKSGLFADARFPLLFGGRIRDEAFPEGVDAFGLSSLDEREAIWDRLRQPHVIAGFTTWALYRLITDCMEPGRDGPTLPLFDLVCIDEASQMMVAQGLMALGGMAPGCRVLVAGDHQQLPPVQAVFNRAVDGRQLGSSLYEFLRTAGAPEVGFEETRRMNQPLAAFGSREFYEDRFYPAADIADEQLKLRDNWQDGLSDWQKVVLNPAYPIVILLHDGPAAGVENAFERSVVVDLLRCFFERMLPGEGEQELTPEFFWRERVAVITPHRAQNAALRSRLGHAPWGRACVVDTVDGIQGKERDAIVASYTVADTEFAQAEAEFLFSRNRLNVTTSRARRKLVFIISRRLFEVVPLREDVIDAAQTLRRFVFGAERVEGSVHLADGEGREWPVELRVRRFASSPLPEPLRPGDTVLRRAEMPEFTIQLQEVLRVIREIARTSKYANAPQYAIERQCLRKVLFGELRDLLILGQITLTQAGNPPFWVARPLEPARLPIAIDPDSLQQRVQVLMEELQQGRRAVKYREFRDRFVWVSPEGVDVLRPRLQEFVQEGMLEWTDSDGLLLRQQADLAEPRDLPQLPELSDADFRLLNELEDGEMQRINFGIFELWSSLRDLESSLGWNRSRTVASAERLRQHGYLIIGADDLCRSRMAELAREVRYVKQRFRAADAADRPYLVRSLKLAIRDRNKPQRDRPLSGLIQQLKVDAGGDVHARVALEAVQEMLQRAWSAGDPSLAAFQERAIWKIFRSWIGHDPADAYVITADTGSGKTEAACLPLIAGAAWDQLRGLRGTRALLVYPRIRLTHNQAQRMADYLAHFAAVPEAPTLTLGIQSTGVPSTFTSQYLDESWERRGASLTFPFFDCPNSNCRKPLLLEPGAGIDGADRLFCVTCGWSFRGWVGSQRRIAEKPPTFLLMVTESLHGWMQDPRYGGVFGDCAVPPPRALLADEIHLYALTHGANVGYALRRLSARAHTNAKDGHPPLAIGMSATLGRPDRIWGELSGRQDVVELAPSASERKINPRGREYFYFVQPEVESRSKDVAGASTTIQSLMVLAHGMRRRTGKEGGFRALVFLDSIDKVRRLHGDFLDAEMTLRLARFRTLLYGDDPVTGEPRTECCGDPWSCARFRDGECWYFAANDRQQVTAGGPYRRNRGLSVGGWPVTSKGGQRTAEMLRTSDIIFSTSSLEVGYDDPDMALVYQHYAPLNLASFVQRKGRGGRGADDRPLTGVTLSPYSPRDSWFFRRPEQMIDPSGFEIPLNMNNYFVRRGQAVAVMLDGVARWRVLNSNEEVSFVSNGVVRLTPTAAQSADCMVRAVLGEMIYKELGHSGIEQLWDSTYRARSGDIDMSKSPRDWGAKFPAMPRLLFETITLPSVKVLAQGNQQPDQEDISLALTTAVPGNMTRRYSQQSLHWIVPREGRHSWFSPASCEMQEEILFAEGSESAFIRELPEYVREFVREGFHPKLAQPSRIHMEEAGRRAGEWIPMWGFDRVQQRVRLLHGGDDEAIRIKEKSQGSLRSVLVVRADAQKAEQQSWSLPEGFGALDSFVSAPAGRQDEPGLRASRLFWAADVTLKLDDRNNPEQSITQFFVHPQSGLPMFSGYSVETEGVQLRLNSATLDRFVSNESERLRCLEEGRWLKGKLFSYLLRMRCSASGLNVYHAVRLAELLQSAAGREDLGAELARLMRFWDGGRLRELLARTFEEMLPYHPLLSHRRLGSLGEALTLQSYREAVQTAYRDAADNEIFERYLRSLVINGVAVRLHQMFVLHGRGDASRVLGHAKSAMEYGSDASDTISVFENGMHGDGTTRTFLRHVEEMCEFWRAGGLAECPSAEEDAILERLVAWSESHPEWKDLDPGVLSDMQSMASALGVDPAHAAFDRVIALRFGSELVGSERFELFDLQLEIRQVREKLRAEMRRMPTVWELVSAATQSAGENSSQTLRLAALARAYSELEDAPQEESLSPLARVAEQVLRLGGSLCADGCQACLHAGSAGTDSAAGETAVSRLVLARYSEFVFGLASTDARK